MEKEIPIGWIEVQLIDLLESLETGSRPKGGVQGILDGIPSVGGEHLNSDGGFKFENIKFVPEQFASSMNRGEIKENDILIVKDGATTGKTSYVDSRFPFKKAFVNEHVFLCRPYKFLNSKAIYYFLRGSLGQERILNNFAGAAQGGINTKFASNTLIPLPPLPEQKRIVAKLDTLFGQLDKIKTHLECIPQLLKDFRQKVLTQAVTGKLTEEWRELNKIAEYSKEVKLIDILVEKPRNGYSPQGVEYVTDVKSLTLGATTSGKFDSSKIKYLDIETPPKDSYLWLKSGDILIQRSNSFDYVGVSAIYDGKDDDFIYPDLMMKLKLKNPDLINYVFYQLSSQKLRTYFRDNATGTAGNMPKINQGIVSNAPITIRSSEEQQEIVRRVESLFAKADKIEASYQKLKAKIEQLPQALLAKAFRGELVEQLPTDGDARELLEEIKKLKEEGAGKGKKLKVENEVNVAAEPGARYVKSKWLK